MGCTQLVILAGPVYTTRLWCIIELFSFLQVHANVQNITVLTLVDATDKSAPSTEEIEAAEERALSAFKRFDVRLADCFATDRDRLLGVVETAFASLDAFNERCRDCLVSAANQDKMLRLRTEAEASNSFKEKDCSFSFPESFSFNAEVSERTRPSPSRAIGRHWAKARSVKGRSLAEAAAIAERVGVPVPAAAGV